MDVSDGYNMPVLKIEPTDEQIDSAPFSSLLTTDSSNQSKLSQDIKSDAIGSSQLSQPSHNSKSCVTELSQDIKSDVTCSPQLSQPSHASKSHVTESSLYIKSCVTNSSEISQPSYDTKSCVTESSQDIKPYVTDSSRISHPSEVTESHITESLTDIQSCVTESSQDIKPYVTDSSRISHPSEVTESHIIESLTDIQSYVTDSSSIHQPSQVTESYITESLKDIQSCVTDSSSIHQPSQVTESYITESLKDILSCVTDSSSIHQPSQVTESYITESFNDIPSSQTDSSQIYSHDINSYLTDTNSETDSSESSQDIKPCVTESSQLIKLPQDSPSYISSSSLLSQPSVASTIKTEPDSDEDDSHIKDLKSVMTVNKSIKKRLAEEVAKLERLLKKSRNRQDLMIQHLKDKEQEENVNKNSSHIRAISLFVAPYFRDSKGMVAPPNEDTILKIKNHDVNSYLGPPRPWKMDEQKRLVDGITSYSLLCALTPIKRDKDFIKRKMKDKNVTDEDLEALEQELYIVDEKIKFTKRKSLEELIVELKGKIDWMTVSATHMQGIRSPEECEMMWNNVLSFSVNKFTFTEEEDAALKDIVEEHNEKNWDAIAAALGPDRTAIQCFERYQVKVNPKLKKKLWTDEEDKRLLELIEEHRCGEIIPWNKISLEMEGRTRQQLINRYERSLSQMCNRAAWTPEEDGILIALVQKYGHHWNKMQSFFKRRSTYAIRERYCNALTPNIRVGPWTLQEDKLLISLIRKFGYGKWARICKYIPGRTDNMCLIRAARLVEWSITYHSKNSKFDRSKYTPDMYADILRPCAPSKYCPIRNERVRAYRENGLKMLLKALEKVAPDYRATIHNLNSIDLKWMNADMLHKISNVLHANFGGRPAKERNPIPPLKYLTKPMVPRKKSEPVSENEEEIHNRPPSPEMEIPREEKDFIDSALFHMFDEQSSNMLTTHQKLLNFGARQIAEMSLYKAYLYSQFCCKTLCDADDNLENVTFAKVDYRETIQIVIPYFMQPPVYDKQFITLAPNLTTMLGFETIDCTTKGLRSMSECVSQSKAYVDYLCERRRSCPQCLQCSLRFDSSTSRTTPEFVMQNIKNKMLFVLNERLENSAYIESGSKERLKTSCTCKDLADSKKSVQLLRKRFLSLFLWPAFFTTVEFNKEQEQAVSKKHRDDYLLDMELQEPKERCRKRRTTFPEKNSLKNPRLKRNNDVGDASKSKRKRIQPKENQIRRRVSKPALRKSRRSCVLNRSSFVPEECKHHKTTLKACQEVHESEIISDILSLLSDENNSLQLMEGDKKKLKESNVVLKSSQEFPVSEMNSNVLPSSSVEINSSQFPEIKKRKHKSSKLTPKVSKKLSLSGIITDDLPLSTYGNNSSQLVEITNKKRKSCKPTPKSSRKLIISDSLSPSDDRNNSSQSLEEKKRKRRNYKPTPRTCQKLPISEMISDALPPSLDRNKSSEEKKNKRKVISKTTKMLPIAEMISDNLSPTSDDRNNSSQLLEDKKKKRRNNSSQLLEDKKKKRRNNSSQLLEDKKKKRRNNASQLLEDKKRKSSKLTQKASHALEESEMISGILSESVDNNSTLSQLPKESAELTTTKKKRYRNYKVAKKAKHELSASVVILNDVKTSTDDVINLSQFPDKKRNDASSLPVKRSKCKKHEPSPIIKHALSDNDLLSASEIVSSQLQKEIECKPSSQPKKRNKRKNTEPVLHTQHKSPISVMLLDDMKPSIDKNNDLSNENKSRESFLSEKKDNHKSCKLFPKTNTELSVSEMLIDVPSSSNENSSLSQLTEKYKCNEPFLSEKNTSKINKLLGHKIISNMSLLEDRNNLLQVPKENKFKASSIQQVKDNHNSLELTDEYNCDMQSFPKKRNKRKSRIPVQRIRHLLPVSEVNFDTSPPAKKMNSSSLLPKEIKYEARVVLEKLNIDVSAFLGKQASINVAPLLNGVQEKNDPAFLLGKDKESASFSKNKNKESKNMSKSLDKSKNVSVLFVKDDEKKSERVRSSSEWCPNVNGNNSSIMHEAKSEMNVSFLPGTSLENVLPLSKANIPAFPKKNSSVTVLEEGDETAIALDDFSISSDSCESCDQRQEFESVIKELASNSEVELSEMDMSFR